MQIDDDEELYRSTHQVLTRIATRRFHFDADDANELAQETWALFLEKRRDIRIARSWLAGTIANLCRQRIDQRIRLRERCTAIDDTHDSPFESDEVSRIAIRDVLKRVDERTRELCRLLVMEGASYEDVSQTLGIPLGSVGPLFIRAKAKVRAVFASRPELRLCAG